MKASVITCRPRRDEQFLVVVKANGVTYPVLSSEPVKEGSDVRVAQGRVVAS